MVELGREGVEMFNASERIEWTQQTVKYPDLFLIVSFYNSFL